MLARFVVDSHMRHHPASDTVTETPAVSPVFKLRHGNGFGNGISTRI